VGPKAGLACCVAEARRIGGARPTAGGTSAREPRNSASRSVRGCTLVGANPLATPVPRYRARPAPPAHRISAARPPGGLFCAPPSPGSPAASRAAGPSLVTAQRADPSDLAGPGPAPPPRRPPQRSRAATRRPNARACCAPDRRGLIPPVPHRRGCRPTGNPGPRPLHGGRGPGEHRRQHRRNQAAPPPLPSRIGPVEFGMLGGMVALRCPEDFRADPDARWCNVGAGLAAGRSVTDRSGDQGAGAAN
jgi:hypothetical protein